MRSVAGGGTGEGGTGEVVGRGLFRLRVTPIRSAVSAQVP